jgi:DNA-binding winged helix-turn-helix (wHTH) protein/Tol biopolymer transport system component
MFNGTKELYEFGPFRLDPGERLLTRDGVPLELTPKVFDTLLVLIQNSGRLLEKRELMERIWPDSFVEQSNLAQSISILRKVLGESRLDHRYIQTAPGHGYRFVLPVRAIHCPLEEPVSNSPQLRAATGTEPQNAANSRPGRIWQYTAAAGLVALCGLGVWWTFPSAKHAVPYMQLTDFTDSAIAPVLSPDGRMVAFIRGNDWFLSPDEIWVKALPNGEPVQLTHDPRSKFAPSFSPDGSRVAYSATEPARSAWLTVTVPVIGGEPQTMLRNAEGLTWLGDGRLLFSEIKTGMHMAVVTAGENRLETRDVYVPEHERAMAHFSYASPDRKWVLVIEMDATTAWQPCRLVPFDGSSRGFRAGPSGQCTAAGWSPDGAWMYFSVRDAGGHHLWRQRFPKAAPEQITHGSTTEQGVAVAPDGRSLITSIGMEQSAIWIHDSSGDQQLSTAGQASSPTFSHDARQLYYLLRRELPEPTDELLVADLDTRQSERLLAGFSITSYDVSDDGSEAVFAAKPAGGQSQIWLASLDRRSSPRQLASGGESAPHFGPGGEIVFQQSVNRANYLFRMNRDGTGRAMVAPFPISNVMSISPDRHWAATLTPVNDAQAPAAEIAIPLQGGAPKRICSGYCIARWSPDGRFLYLTFAAAKSTAQNSYGTAAIPLRSSSDLSELPASGIHSIDEAVARFGGFAIRQSNFTPGLDPNIFAYIKTTMHRNLFRIPL